MKKIKSDGLMYYWHDSRKRKHNISHRDARSCSVIVWGAIFACRKSQLSVFGWKQADKAYFRTFSYFLLSEILVDWYGYMIFQHDNAAIYAANLTAQIGMFIVQI